MSLLFVSGDRGQFALNCIHSSVTFFFLCAIDACLLEGVNGDRGYKNKKNIRINFNLKTYFTIKKLFFLLKNKIYKENPENF